MSFTNKAKNIQFARLEQWTHTQKIADNFPVPPPSIKYTHQQDFTFKNQWGKTNVMVEPIDTIDCAHTLKTHGYNPAVLNLADNTFPGGCVGFGSGAQEESLFRRSNYFKTLDIKLYPIEPSQAIYSPGVTIFFQSENSNWKIISTPFKLDFIACPGIKFPVLEADKFSQLDKSILFDKIDLIFQIAYTHGHDSLVLGALGCGAWKCPAEQVAQIFDQVIKKWSGVFKLIVFAILKPSQSMYLLNDIHQSNSNWDIFSNGLAKEY